MSKGIMKKIILLSVMSLMLVACGKSYDKEAKMIQTDQIYKANQDAWLTMSNGKLSLGQMACVKMPGVVGRYDNLYERVDACHIKDYTGWVVGTYFIEENLKENDGVYIKKASWNGN
jgi:hypothetical protein